MLPDSTACGWVLLAGAAAAGEAVGAGDSARLALLNAAKAAEAAEGVAVGAAPGPEDACAGPGRADCRSQAGHWHLSAMTLDL